MKSKGHKYGNWVIQHRWLIIIATILFVGISAIGVHRLEMNMDGRLFFSHENPHLQALDALENTYTKTENVFIAIAPKDGNVFTNETLAAVEALTKSCWKIPYSNRVDSITNFQHSWAIDDELIVEDLVQNAKKLSPKELDRIKAIALSEPFLVNRLISASGEVTGINVNTIKAGHSIKEVPEITTYTRKIVEELLVEYPHLDIYLSGDILIDATFAEAAERDIKTLIPIMFLVLIVIMGLTLRSFPGIVSTFLVLLFSVLTGMGLAGWTNISLNPSSANAPIIILTVVIADSIHMLITIFEQMRGGASKSEAIAESLSVNMQPVFLTSLTTAIGFLSMNFSDSPPFGDLGNIVAIGVAAAWVYSIMFIPALISVLPIRVKVETHSPDVLYLDRLSSFIVNRHRPILWFMTIFIIVISLGTFKIELNDDFLKYFDKSFHFRQSSDFIMKNLTGLVTLEYSLDSGEENGIHSPRYLKKIEEFVGWYKKQPNIVHVSTITDTIKRLNQNLHNDNPEFYRIPEDPELVAQYLLLYEMSLPFGQDLNNEINVDKSATRIVVTINDVTTKEIREIDMNAQNWLKKNAPKSMLTCGSSISMIWAHISERNITSMVSSSFSSFGLISIILIVALRSIKFGLLSLIPNITPAFMAFGVWGFIAGRVGLAVSVIASFTLGIVCDDTIHFMSFYLRARREKQLSPGEAIQYTFRHVGPAMLTTSLILVAGFLVLSLSGFKVNSELGLMTAITIALAPLLDFFFLPVILIKFEEKKHATETASFVKGLSQIQLEERVQDS